MLPAVGSIWVWEPDVRHAQEVAKVVEVKWNGEEWWVASTPVPCVGHILPWEDTVVWNSLDRWWESAHEVVMTRG